MKNKLFNILIAGSCAFALASCDDNSWNDEHLNGFNGDPEITDVQSIEYTLTAADYSSIANNATNKSLAGDALASALKAVGTQGYFTPEITAKDYVPAFLGSSNFQYFVLDNGSSVKVTYNVATNLPEEITAAAAATQYEVSDADYVEVWGSDEDYVSAFTPSHSAAKNIPSILKANLPDAQAGQYVIVSYNNANSEPVFGGVEDNEPAYTHKKVTAITPGRSYVLAAEGNAATAIDESKSYGYLNVTAVTPEKDGLIVEDATSIEFRFEAAPNGNFYIIDAFDRYLYQKGTYNSFNLSTSLPSEGAEWSVAVNGDGSIAIKNVLVEKTIQYDTNYNSYGSYSDVKGLYPVAYEKVNDYTSIIGTVEKGNTYDVVGVVSGICAQGYMLTDNSGTILVYYGKSYDSESHKIGDIVKISGTIGSYNKGLQITGSSATEEIIGAVSYKFPVPATLSGADLDAELTSRTEDGLATYVSLVGTVSVSGNYVNLIVDGATTAQGSPYQLTAEQKALFTDGAIVNVEGWYIAISGGKYISLVVTEVATANASKSSRSLIASVPSEKENAVYYYDGSNWSVPADFSVLNPADYTAMGQNYGNLSTSAKPEEYLPLYLKNKFPYAQIEDVENVLYKYYDGSSTYYRCDQYAFDGTAWILNNGIVEESAQFVKNNGQWMYDPNVTITLPNGGSYDICKLYYQTCVDWVFENIDKPLGSSDIKSGKGYVTSYGNNEYYCGTSAYYGNVDIRPDKALTQYPAGYEGKTNDEIIQLMKDRFCYEVMPAALSILHADATPVEGLDVIYTINFAVYTGTTTMHTVRYQVVAPATFEFIDCTWYEESAE